MQTQDGALPATLLSITALPEKPLAPAPARQAWAQQRVQCMEG